jgi:oxalate decarboxylase
MTPGSRREFLVTAAAAPLVRPAAPGDLSFQNNVPDPLLAGPELPTFTFALEKTEGKTLGGSYGKEATVAQLPISKGIAGVSMRLEPGVMRELHWHATAAEWAFVVSGRVRTTVVGPDGDSAIDDFGPGDLWYFPRGHGHVLQCLGDEPCHFILVFDNGYFSEFGTFSITDWLGHVPRGLLARNFGLPEAAFEGLPSREVYFARGAPAPVDPPAPLRGRSVDPPLSHRFRMLAQEPHSVHRGGTEWRVDASRFPISRTITGVLLDLEPGGFRELHWHPNADEWQYLIEGHVGVTLFGAGGRFRAEELRAGDVAYIPQGYGHSIEELSGRRSRVLIAFNSGRYESIDLSLWIAANPAAVLATNFGKPPEFFDAFPRGRVFLGPVAPQAGP